ncbi:PACE efflux transporter [Methylobrevis albus]|uniref:PACE efflux transporter n=1 Tax=Methylobrevis albus TaxID=2793297 RepID=A0A931HZT8_9HYPH|nr:PACE efflux transporter [Methylobrevis albus]MBH0236361.1 PACE efflux transporter [Methylobrevis albus]
MRSTADRIRHAVSFEISGLLIITPLLAWAFGYPMQEMGPVAVAAAIIAGLWTYGFNLGFDRVLQRRRGTTQKSVGLRIVHAVLFEVGLLALLVPMIAWALGMSLLAAFLMDVSFGVFFGVYAFCFNWAYDIVFPVPGRPLPEPAA